MVHRSGYRRPRQAYRQQATCQQARYEHLAIGVRGSWRRLLASGIHHSENSRLERFGQRFPAVNQSGQPGIFLRRKRPIARHRLCRAMRFVLIYRGFCDFEHPPSKRTVVGSIPAGRIDKTP